MTEPRVISVEDHRDHGFHLSPNEPPDPQARGLFAALRRVFSGAEVIRYLIVGGFNTAFSFALYSGCVVLFTHLLPGHGKPFIADVAFAVSTPISITVSFLGFKHFVFRTKGNYLREWLRCFTVYSFSFPMGLIILPAATHLFEHLAMTRQYAPFLAGVVNSVCIACYSYFGHKKFSFKR